MQQHPCPPAVPGARPTFLRSGWAITKRPTSWPRSTMRARTPCLLTRTFSRLRAWVTTCRLGQATARSTPPQPRWRFGPRPRGLVTSWKHGHRHPPPPALGGLPHAATASSHRTIRLGRARPTDLADDACVCIVRSFAPGSLPISCPSSCHLEKASPGGTGRSHPFLRQRRLRSSPAHASMRPPPSRTKGGARGGWFCGVSHSQTPLTISCLRPLDPGPSTPLTPSLQTASAQLLLWH